MAPLTLPNTYFNCMLRPFNVYHYMKIPLIGKKQYVREIKDFSLLATLPFIKLIYVLMLRCKEMGLPNLWP
jgi:hypothetical protein